jgi:hypothetical protein
LNAITVRKMDFRFEEIDPVFIEGNPDRSFGLIGLSLLLPYLEPYLIRTMKVAKKQIDDPKLVDELERFCAQEGHHFQMHMRFNEALRRERFPELEKLEADLSADYQRFSKTKSLRFNLAYAEGFEALTTASALFSFMHAGMGQEDDSAVADLFAWHMVEEFEHRTVAFDVFDRVVGGYFYRLFVGLYGQWHFLRFVGRVVRVLREATAEQFADADAQALHKQNRREQGRLVLRHLLPMVLRTYLPRYTPHRIEFTPEMKHIADRYSAVALETR